MTLRPRQCVQNAAARLVTNTRSRDHITPVLKDPHWLPVDQRIKYQPCLMTHHIDTQQCPEYTCDLVTLTATKVTRSGLHSAENLSYSLICSTFTGTLNKLHFILFIHFSSHFIFHFLHVILMEYACLLACTLQNKY